MDETLIKQVGELTGLSQASVESILKEWVVKTGKSPKDLSLDDLRPILVSILQDVFTEVAEGRNDYLKLSG